MALVHNDEELVRSDFDMTFREQREGVWNGEGVRV